MFFAGTLQEGIALAVQESKAVICFVPDDGETSSTWQEEYFTGDEQFTQILEARSVLLRIAKDSPEAGFLASVCPVSQYPTVVVIKNGMLRDYIVPDITKDEFRNRITAAVDDIKPGEQPAVPLTAQQLPEQSQETNSSPAPAPGPVIAAPTSISSTPEHSSRNVPESKSNDKGKKPVYGAGSPGDSARTPRKQEEHKAQQAPGDAPAKGLKKDIKGKAPIRTIKNEKPTDGPSTSYPTPKPGPPAQYRLQVRLFDGSSVRSAFSPSHTIYKDVRPWLDGQLEEKKPYNLKHILTPLPNKTLSITEEDQTLRELITGSTATFVMVPIKTYIEAYSDTGSLPVRAVSSVYGLVTSAIGTGAGYVGSLLGYASPPPQSASPQSNEPQPQHSSDTTRPSRPWGPNIRTLRDQGNEQDKQFYNGNQLNFEPRNDDER
ncbi:hypothetical protein BJX76DRAFT_321486 [Aspergillus varians]